MKEIKIQSQTIIMLIGPSNSGKSFFGKEFLLKSLQEQGVRSLYLSSDDIRRELLGGDLHKHDNEMLIVSKQAFSLLNNQLENYTSYPVNIPVVIVDATNLSTFSRKDVINIAEKNHYNLVGLIFDYTKQDDYIKYIDESVRKEVIFEMISTLKNKTLKELEEEKKSFSQLIKVTSIDSFNDYPVVFEDKSSLIYTDKSLTDYAVVGDIHGCFEEFKEMLSDNKGITIEGNKIVISNPRKYIKHILVGDLVDKGPMIKEVINFVWSNLEHFIIVKGNHEEWVYKYITGQLKKSKENDRLIENWFDTVRLLEADEVLKSRFLDIYDNSFAAVITSNAIITHAPCENKYLGKTDAKSLKAQRNMTYPKKADFATMDEYYTAKEAAFKFLLDDAERNYKFHLFGHTMLPSVWKHKNKVCLDTGCVAGGFLSVALFSKERPDVFIKKYKSRQPKKEELIPYFKPTPKEIDLASLDYDDQKRIKFAANNGLNFISGTMSPADVYGNELESLDAAFDYYKESGVEKVIIQPKFMGSRCQILLHNSDVTKCKAFSRNGFLMKDSWLSTEKKFAELFAELQKRFRMLFVELNVEQILFDGELLPWSSIGGSLIDDQFRTPVIALESELDLLEANGFSEQLEVLRERMNGELTSEHLKAEKRAYDVLEENWQDLNQLREDNEKLKEQVEIFGAGGPLHYKAFSILKTVNFMYYEENLISPTHSNIKIYESVSMDPFLVISFKTNKGMMFDHGGSSTGDEKEMLQKFWEAITNERSMEGVVFKPEFTYVEGVAPYMKVRNPEYLRMVYGPDYDSLPAKKESLIKNKSIKKKLATSIKEWQIGKELLDIKQSEISITNPKWLRLVYSLMNEQKFEKQLDPRL